MVSSVQQCHGSRTPGAPFAPCIHVSLHPVSQQDVCVSPFRFLSASHGYEMRNKILKMQLECESEIIPLKQHQSVLLSTR